MSDFVKRTTKPEAGNPYFVRAASGGYSMAIQGSPTDAGCNVLANCVGYAYGRFNEIGGWGSCKYLRPVNAENFMQYADGLETGQTPRVGAVMVWRKGATLSGSDGAGHVAIVEEVISDTEVLTSESGYGSKAFWTQRRKRGSNYNWGQGSGYKFLGFIYNPAPCCAAPAPQTADPLASLADIERGDVVPFAGGGVYVSSTASKAAANAAAGLARVTHIAPGMPHPFHLEHIDGASTVMGWVDAASIVLAVKEPEAAEPAAPVAPADGDTTGSRSAGVDWDAEDCRFIITASKGDRPDLREVVERLNLPAENYKEKVEGNENDQ